MKNLFKSLSVIAIAGALGLQAVNVNAAETCGTGYKEHTDYFMFLNVSSKTTFENGINDATAKNTQYTRFTSADKMNNVLLDKVIDRGDIAVTDGTRTTNVNAARTWSVEEYWKRYYEGLVARKNKANETYIFHNGWYEHSSNLFQDNGVYRVPGTSNESGLTLGQYLEKVISNNTLSKSDLVTKGTNLPKTDIGGGNQFGTTSNKTVRMTVARYYSEADKKQGAPAGGKEDVYSPAAYFVTYCVKNDEPVNPDKEFKVTYDGNANDATNVPNPVTVKENACFVVANGPKREGYTFLGWNTDKKATSEEAKYKVGSEVCNLTKDITLYAVWKKNDSPVVDTYSIIYNANINQTVTNMPGNGTFNVGTSTNISTMTPVCDGYVFLGWNTDASATTGNDLYKPGALYEDGKDLVLYAIWKKKDSPVLPDNPKTAVVDYLLPLGGTAGISGACLTILKKKKIFKQF